MIQKIVLEDGVFYQIEGKKEHRVDGKDIHGYGLHISRYDPKTKRGIVIAWLSCYHGTIDDFELEDFDYGFNWYKIDVLSIIDRAISCKGLLLDDAFFTIVQRTEKYFSEN